MKNFAIFASLIILFAAFTWSYLFYSTPKIQLISPVLGSSKIKMAENLWFPGQSFKTSFSPSVTAKSALFVETNSGRVLYEKNPKEKLPVASLVKIMTAIVAMEVSTLDSIFEVSSKASQVEPDKMFLIPNEKFTLKELLEGVFLISANDAAEVIAEKATEEGRQEFIGLMNAKAKSLGMFDTLFLNPTGLEEDEQKQYSTAYDVVLMSRYAVKNYPKLVEISSTEHVYYPRRDDRQDYDMYSGINLLTTYPGVLGFKTGYTPEAGLTLVTLARRDDKEILGVLLGSTNRRDDAKVLLDYSFSQL